MGEVSPPDSKNGQATSRIKTIRRHKRTLNEGMKTKIDRNKSELNE